MSNRVVPADSVNLNAIQPPGILVLESLNSGGVSGVPTNTIGQVGTASFGKPNTQISVGSIQQAIQALGLPQTGQYDLGTAVNVGLMQGANVNFVCVRVTDGTDTAALTRLLDTQSVPDTGAILTGITTGSTGNTFQAQLTAGTASGTFNLVIGRPGYISETFTNIGGSGATFWANLISAVNNGQSGLRGPSQLVVASTGDGVDAVGVTSGGTLYTTATVAFPGTGTGAAGTVTIVSGAVTGVVMTNHGHGYTGTVVPVITGDGSGAVLTATLGSSATPATPTNPYAFTGGTDGNTGVTDTTMLGTDGTQTQRTGMYVLRNSNVNLFGLVNATSTTTWGAQNVFAGQIGAQYVVTGTPGQTVAQMVTAKSGAAINDNSFIGMVGDWANYLDTYNSGVTRLISAQPYYLGVMGNLSPEQSPLNKPIFGILSTQTSAQNQVYADADIEAAQLNGIELIAIPAAGGASFFSCQTGKSGGTNQTTNSVYILRMANWIGQSLSKSGVLAPYIGQLQTPDARVSAYGAISSFLTDLQGNSQIEAFSIILDATNNPNSRVVLGFMQASVTVQLFSVIVTFVINLNVGTVTISS